MSKNIGTIYDVLFETLEKVKNGEMDPKQAKAITGVTSAITDTAKLELQAMKEMQYDSKLLKKKEVNGYLELQGISK